MATDPRVNGTARLTARHATISWGALLLACHLAACQPADRTPTPEPASGRGELTLAQRLGREQALAARDPRHAPRLEAGAPALGIGPAIARFAPGGARITLAGRQLTLAAVQIGRAGAGLQPLGAHAAATIAGPEVRRDRGAGVLEWWRSLPSGLEHGLTIAERPAGPGELLIEVEVGGTLIAHPVSSDAVALSSASGTRIATYAHLSVVDAAGASIPARMSVRDGRIAIAVDDAKAQYPVVVDPTLATEEATLIGSDQRGSSVVGTAVGLSADGSRAIVGAPGDLIFSDGHGNAYVFVRSGSSWSEEGLLSVPSDNPDQTGSSVALTADGSRAILGAPFAGGPPYSGRANVFARNGSNWAEEAPLRAADGAEDALLGISVAISADGSRAIAGATGDNAAAGSARIFLRSGTTWSEEAKLVASDAVGGDRLGVSVALSADGSRALVGDYFDDTAAGSGAGSARVFLRTGTTWSEEATLVASDGAAFDGFGVSVALSADASRAIVGAHSDDTTSGGLHAGSATVFVRTGTSWVEEGQLVAADGAADDGFGGTVALSGDGSVAIVGVQSDNTGTGSVRVFRRTGTTWAEEATLAASDGAFGDQFGASISLSGDGSLAIAGVPLDDNATGANSGSARVFALSATSPPCTTAADCDSGLFCVQNACCATACGGPICPGTTAIPGCVAQSASSCAGPCDVDLRGGTDVEDGLTLTFQNGIDSGGEVSVKPCSAASSPPTGYKIVVGSAGQYCWDLETNAGYTTPPPIIVCLHYPLAVATYEDTFHMEHDDGSGFLPNTTDRCLSTNCRDTSSPCTDPCDPAVPPGTICGFANSLSPFVLVEPIDVTPPVFTPPPADITAYATSTNGAVVNYALPTAVDNLDGPTAVECTPASGTRFAPGRTTVTCTTADRHANGNTATFVVWVQYQAPADGAFFLQPINPDDSSVFKRGSTIPVKFKLQGTSAGINNLAAQLAVAKVSNGVSGTYVEAVSTGAADEGSSFRFDAAGGQYIFNLSTKSMSVGTWSLRADLGDLVDHTINVSLR